MGISLYAAPRPKRSVGESLRACPAEAKRIAGNINLNTETGTKQRPSNNDYHYAQELPKNSDQESGPAQAVFFYKHFRTCSEHVSMFNCINAVERSAEL